MLGQTPSQTVGPFFRFGLLAAGGENILVDNDTQGQRIILRGQVFDGTGAAIEDAMIEIWQADSQGIFNSPEDPRCENVDKHFRGFGRSGTSNKALEYSFKTIKPGAVPWEADQHQAPHINMRVFARGVLLHLITRAYFSDEESNTTDPILNSIDDESRRQTLIAIREEIADAPTYRMNIHLQGDHETVFFYP